jgi:dTDP-glucose 4,6-dehydratase
MYTSSLSKEDIDFLLKFSENLFKNLAGKKIFISGATGFFGKWLVQTLTLVNLKMGLNLELHLLSRNWKKFLNDNPHFIDSNSTFLYTDDIINFKYPIPCEIIIHAANEARPNKDPLSIENFKKTVEEGSQRLLSYAHFSQTQKMLLTSSGAVYGTNNISFNEDSNITSPTDFYGLAKLKQEMLFADYQSAHNTTDIIIARCFAFAGPYLPLDKGYALGEFINNAINDQKIFIRGNGQSLRSYLYTADLMIWLFTLLLECQKMNFYNIGSNEPVSILSLAEKVSNITGNKHGIEIENNNKITPSISDYVPNTDKALKDFNLKVYTPLNEAIEKTFKWHKDRIG